jgi:hypothetical protein
VEKGKNNKTYPRKRVSNWIIKGGLKMMAIKIKEKNKPVDKILSNYLFVKNIILNMEEWYNGSKKR